MSSLDRFLDVLVVDDDDLIREYIALVVIALGCRVATAADGREALTHLAGNPVDVLITDWQMPHLDGIELVRKVRAEPREKHLHIVMMTTHAAGRTIRDGLAVEVDDLLFKPVDLLRLELAVSTARRVVTLQRRLARRNTHLAAASARTRAAYRQIRRGLEAAAITQRNLLPAQRLDGPVRHAWLFIPTLGIGGDTLNVCRLADGTTFFFQLDVCGHGIPAALQSFSLHHRFSARPPSDVTTMSAMLRALNRDAQNANGDSFYTLLCGLIDRNGERVDLIRAGHPLALHQSGETVQALAAGNLPMGLVPDETYSVTSLSLAPGDRLIIHSDGVSECADASGEPFGEDRLLDFFRDRAEVPLATVVKELEGELRQFRGAYAFEDDVSLLVMERA